MQLQKVRWEELEAQETGEGENSGAAGERVPLGVTGRHIAIGEQQESDREHNQLPDGAAESIGGRVAPV